MKRVEDYIKAYTRRCNNELTDGGYADWLTPDHARNVAVITRDETIKEACKWLGRYIFGDRQGFIEDFKNAMKALA